MRNIAAVTTAVANGDLSKKITVDVRGEILELKNPAPPPPPPPPPHPPPPPPPPPQRHPTQDHQHDGGPVESASFLEVTRVAREVGTEGKLGGQAEVKGVAGTWKDLTDNVNFMAGNLTNQVRGIATVVTAVANGDLKRKLTVDAKGEIAALADTINSMIDTLAFVRRSGDCGAGGGCRRKTGRAGVGAGGVWNVARSDG